MYIQNSTFFMSSLGYGAEENGFEFQQAKPTTQGRLAYKGEFFFFFLGGGGAADRECAGYVFFYKSQKRGFSFRSVQKFVCDRHLKLPASSMYKW